MPTAVGQTRRVEHGYCGTGECEGGVEGVMCDGVTSILLTGGVRT